MRGANIAQNAAASKLCTSSNRKILLVVWVLLQIGPTSLSLTGDSYELCAGHPSDMMKLENGTRGIAFTSHAVDGLVTNLIPVKTRGKW